MQIMEAVTGAIQQDDESRRLSVKEAQAKHKAMDNKRAYDDELMKHVKALIVTVAENRETVPEDMPVTRKRLLVFNDIGAKETDGACYRVVMYGGGG